MHFNLKASIAGALVLVPIAGFAAVDGSHHDMVHMGVGTSGVEKCAFCHSITGLSAVAGYGEVGGFCVQVCHSSGTAAETAFSEAMPTGPGQFNAAMAVTAGLADPSILSSAVSHGFLKAVIPTPDDAAAVEDTSWPHTGATEASIQCTSCHAVHDPTNTPFLNARLGTGDNTTAFCQQCHDGRAAAGTTGRYQDFANAGAHPTEFDWDPAAALARATYAGSGAATGQKDTDAATYMMSRVIADAAANLQITPTIAAGVFNDPNNNWNTGGHILDLVSGLPTTATGNFGCYSCHSAHQEQNATGEQGDLLLLGGAISYFCHGCHGTDPGATGFGHPIYADAILTNTLHSDWGSIPLTAAYAALTTPLFRPDPPNGNPPYCVSCHDVHEGALNLMAIRRVAGTESPTSSVCLSCHQDSFSVAAVNSHHPGIAGNDYNATHGFATAAAWLTVDNNGDLTDGLSCPDCHVGTGNDIRRSTAHNWAP